MLMANMAELGRVRAMLNQYSQKHRKPCQGPKSWRVQAYTPPASGYLWISAATATPRGAANSTAAPIHRITEAGPALAATAIQRGPTMHASANRVRSRRPSSRLRWVMPSGLGLGRQEPRSIMALAKPGYSRIVDPGPTFYAPRASLRTEPKKLEQ